jgi:hypothetical protein
MVQQRPFALWAAPVGVPPLAWTSRRYFWTTAYKRLRGSGGTGRWAVYLRWMDSPSLFVDLASPRSRLGVWVFDRKEDAISEVARLGDEDLRSPERLVELRRGRIYHGPLSIWTGTELQ